MLASLCLMCYDGDWGAYRYRYYCSRNCFQTFTYEECLQKLTFSQKDLESIQSDFEFITNNRNFFNGLVNQGVLPNETTDETTENIDHLMVSSTSHRPEVHPVQNVHFSHSKTSVSCKNRQKSTKKRKEIPLYKISLLGSG
ncbi:hypothetical protein KQX54_010424 [Cotesia glomerata]|uniref:Uncharacterized protein n=1 Tax=Cotesia glomerata TaxID=32391 RepID=A0AAV7J006_COTGL|nr:hypothetical protein KQX54_010424 [Cotesia glomerata]